MKRLSARVLVVIVAASVALSAQTLSTERLKRIDRYFQEQVDEERIAGAVALVLQDGKPVYEKAFGWADKESKRKMTTDAIFRIASQSKALTSAVIMSLMEEGKLATQRSSRTLYPHLRKDDGRRRKRYGGDHRPGEARDHHQGSADAHRRHFVWRRVPDRRMPTRPRISARSPAAAGTRPTRTSRSATRWSASAPFRSWTQPGDAYVYGYNIDILGCIAEKASGIPLDELIRTRITQPLGLKDTVFYLPTAERNRLVTVYASNADNGSKIFRAPDGPLGQGNYVDGPRRNFSGGAGLLSTAHDYARFLEMIRQGGALDGVRILSPRTVELMTTNQSGTLHSDTGLGFGYGFETTDRFGANGLDGVGAFGWGGAYGSNYRVDPKSRLVLVMMINQMPNASTVGNRFPTLVYQALQ